MAGSFAGLRHTAIRIIMYLWKNTKKRLGEKKEDRK